jgi:perosamine synthetase
MVSTKVRVPEPPVIRLAQPVLGEEELAAIEAVLRSGFLVQGERVRAFESAIAMTTGCAEVVAVSSGTAALHLALLAIGVGPGDRVAVPTYSWPATANAVALCGAEVVFVEIDPTTFNMDPKRLDRTLRAASRVKVVLPVHAFGGMADMPSILEVAERHGAQVIEDAACALGAVLDRRGAGTWGTMGCFSFHPRKVITTGEGGAIATNKPELASRVRMLRNHGLDPVAPQPDFLLPGFNYRMNELQGTMGVVQMGRFAGLMQDRLVAARRYDQLLQGSGIRVPITLAPGAHVYQAYVALLPIEVASRRSEVISRLRARSIEVTIGTHHIPLTTYWAGRGPYVRGNFPVTDEVAARAIALPLHPRITSEEQHRVVSALIEEISSPRAGITRE